MRFRFSPFCLTLAEAYWKILPYAARTKLRSPSRQRPRYAEGFSPEKLTKSWTKWDWSKYPQLQATSAQLTSARVCTSIKTFWKRRIRQNTLGDRPVCRRNRSMKCLWLNPTWLETEVIV